MKKTKVCFKCGSRKRMTSFYRHKQMAVRNGKVVRLPCEVCGDPKSEGHHHDYRKPLDVHWLCLTHHRALHAGEITL